MSTAAYAANAYRLAQGLANRPDRGQSADTAGRPDFGQMVKAAIGEVANQGRVSENKALAYANGKADVIDVVTAVAETQTAFETMVTLRDKVISAYEEIMKMPI
ncbi:flagellar hook-basal body complex protein FliE [Siculibacillus lacustris]|uniref:Flagellar hook-basal body complex protein FliE n=1 Tax=Siculibacillus lacustris TaxID=1549641 RepID=A0A4Q9VR15_9HYPH|nr:flagellar hook-basal body complex protein FliE [Siculibacillus lacustris]TBW38183.1 flagellar hook-basal body complex protein FliE [Siculibacillus lacustris]